MPFLLSILFDSLIDYNNLQPFYKMYQIVFYGLNIWCLIFYYLDCFFFLVDLI